VTFASIHRRGQCHIRAFAALARVTEPSLILFRGGNWSDIDVIAPMRDLLEALNETDIKQSILVVDRERVRRRRLPIRS